jgi:hypothetical protein
MSGQLRDMIKGFPRDATVGQILNSFDLHDRRIQKEDVRCRNCGRLIAARSTDWVHVAPNGATNRTCRTAAYDDPKPGDTDKREWCDWPNDSRRVAQPPKQQS